MTASSPSSDLRSADAALVRVGAGYQLLPPPPVKDAGRVKIGAGYKLLPTG